MAELKQEKLSDEIKVRIENGIATIGHSDAYNAQMERFVAGERFTAQEKAANQKLIDAEDAQMEAARRDPVQFLRQQEAKRLGEEAQHRPAAANAETVKTEKEPVAKEMPVQSVASQPLEGGSDKKLTDAERLERAKQAFAESSPEDRAIAQKNLEGVQNLLAKVPYMTHEFLVQAQQKAYMDEGEKLYEKNIAALKKENALTWEVANFSQAPGKNMVNADVGVAVETGAAGYGVSASHGFDAKALGLTLAEGNVGVNADSDGAVGAHVGVRAVKQIYGEGDHNMFLAGEAKATVSSIETDPTLGGSATGLLVNTHQLGGRPTSEIVGGVVNLETGDVTAVGSVSQTFNADTKYATTARAVGTYGVETGSGGFSLEAYQKTGIDKLTARLSAGVSNVGETNDISVGAGVSLGF